MKHVTYIPSFTDLNNYGMWVVSLPHFTELEAEVLGG